MFIFEIGERFINLPHMVETERLAPSKVRVTMISGNTFDNEGPDADRLVDQLRTLAKDPHLRASTTVIRYDQGAENGGSSVAG